METYTLHTHDSAPEGARAAMTAVEQKLGFVPNLVRTMAESPATLDGYLALGELLATTSLSPVEQQLVLVAVSRANACEYCVAAHSAGLRQAGMAPAAVEAVRDGRPLADPRLEALRTFTEALVETRGWPGPEVLGAFREAGFAHQQVLEVILAVGMKTISNYVNHITGTPLDPQLRGFAWAAEATSSHG